MVLKKRLIIDIEVKQLDNIYPEEGKIEESDYEPDEVQNFRKSYTETTMVGLVNHIRLYFEDQFKEEFIDNLDEDYIEGLDDFEDYGIKIDVKKGDLDEKL